MPTATASTRTHRHRGVSTWPFGNSKGRTMSRAPMTGVYRKPRSHASHVVPGNCPPANVRLAVT